MPNKTITIEVNFGSDFQVAPAMRTLEQSLEAFASEVREYHKDNRVEWTIVDGTSAPDQSAGR